MQASNIYCGRLTTMKRRDFVKSAIGAAAAAYIPSSRSSAFPGELRVLSRTGLEKVLKRGEIEDLASSLRRALLVPDSPRYDETRKLWNGLWDDRRPALIAPCIDISDIVNAVNFARTHDLMLSVRGGGHGISGQAVCDRGMMIDLSGMRSVYINTKAGTASVEGGALLGDLDRESQAYGMVCPAGVVSHTGVAGLTLGGGIGILMRKYGLTIDNLLSVEIVTPDGQIRHASAEENSDLFWGVRGGGGNFGVVSMFKYRLHEFGPNILTSTSFYAPNQAKDMFDRFFEVSENAPDDFHIWAGMTTRETGDPMTIMGFTYAGSMDKADRLTRPLRGLGKPISEFTAPVNYVKQQSRIDAHNSHGRNYYIKGRHVNDYDPAMIDNILERWLRDPRRLNTMRLVTFGGAMADVANDATAWPHRNAKWDLELGASWVDSGDSEEFVEWGRDYWGSILPYTADTFYTNEIMDEKQDEITANYKANHKRLLKVKNTYDPKNLFRLNANIRSEA